MPRFIKLRTASKGLVPGSLVFIGKVKQEKIRIRVMHYDRDSIKEDECSTLEEAFAYLDQAKMTWINIDGLHDPEIIGEIGRRLSLAPLILEDIMNTDHRPKYEESGEHIFVTAKFLKLTQESRMESEQLSLLIGDHYVVSFQERVGTYFDSLRQRIRQAPTRIRSINPDYLAYALLDCLVDEYIDVTGKTGALIEAMEEDVLQNPDKNVGSLIYQRRIEMIHLRKIIRPLREITTSFLQTKSPLIKEETRSFFRDLDDHVITALDTVESYQTMIADLYNMYNVNISNRANEIMKTLTIFAAIFIPLTFVAGIYGMNFDLIPELRWPYGYLYFWGLILVLAGGLLFYFKRKKWF